MKTRDETVVHWFEDWPTPSELNNEDQSHQFPFAIEDVTWMDGRYVLVTTRYTGGDFDLTFVEWLDSRSGGLESQKFVAANANARFRPGYPDELILARPCLQSSILEVVPIESFSYAVKRSVERRVEDIGSLMVDSIHCSSDGDFLAFVRCQNDTIPSIQIRSCDSLEVWWERLSPMSRCVDHDSVELKFSKSFSHMAFTNFDSAWVCPID